MTTGSYTFGSPTGPIYHYKSWSGANGKATEEKSIVYGFMVRKLREKSKVVYYTEKVLRKGKPKLVVKHWVIPAQFDESYIERIRHFRPKVVRSINAYDMTRKEGVSIKGSNPTYGAYISMNYGFDQGYLSWDANDENRLLSKLAASVRGHQFNLGVAIGEGRETISMLLLTMRRITGAIKAVKKGRIDLALRHLGTVPAKEHRGRGIFHSASETVTLNGVSVKRLRALKSTDISSMWLEIQYGWRPLLSDVYESMKAYSAITDEKRTMRFQVRAGKSKERTFYPVDITYFTVWERLSLSRQIIYYASEKMSTARSLGLADPRAVAWELIPYSFVVDWFIPIGTYLDNLACLPKLEGRFCKTQRIATQSSATGTAGNLNYAGASNKTSSLTVSRDSLYTNISVPLPSFIPLENSLSLGKVKNAFALLHQAFAK